MRREQPGKNDLKVFDISNHRRWKNRIQTNCESVMAAQNPKGFDGQSTLYRGNLYVHIDDNGKVAYEIVKAERKDAPALVMACLIMAMKLTQLVDETDSNEA